VLAWGSLKRFTSISALRRFCSALHVYHNSILGDSDIQRLTSDILEIELAI